MIKTDYTAPISYATKEQAITALERDYGYDPMLAGELAQCEDTGRWAHKDDLVSCDHCKEHYEDRSELDDDFLCEDCGLEAAEERQHIRDLNSDYYASRGV